MDVSQILQAVSSVGFPIVACAALFVVYQRTQEKLTNVCVQMLQTISEITLNIQRLNERVDALEGRKE